MNSLEVNNPSGEFITVKQCAENCNLSTEMVKKIAKEGECIIQIGDRTKRIDAQKFYTYLREKYTVKNPESDD